MNTFVKNMLKYICCSPISFLDFLKLTLLRQKNVEENYCGCFETGWGLLGASTFWPHFLPPTSGSTIVTSKDQILQKTAFFTLVKKGLALGSSGCLLVTMPRMVQYTGKWLLLSPYWSHPRPHKMGKRNEWSSQSFA